MLDTSSTAALISDHWYGTDGPHNADIVIVGESWGAEEAIQKKPFVGSSGIEYNRILDECGIDRRKVFMTNMVAERPQSNETYRLFVPSDLKPTRIDGLAPSEQVKSEIRRLYRQIVCYPRKLVVATGNWSLWALSKGTTSHKKLAEANGRKIPKELQTWAPGGILDWRGSMLYINPHPEFCESPEQAEALKKIRLLPVIHPAGIMRAWYLRAPTVHDFKTRVPMALRDDWRQNPAPVTLSPPTFNQAVQRLQYWLNLASQKEIWLANDIETIRRTFISVVGFADSTNFAMCIPFVSRDNPDGSIASFWTMEQEAILVGLIRRVLSHPQIHIIGQNYIYDTQYIQHWWGVTPRLVFDTMLAQNVVFPGTPKDLGYLSSLYCTYHWYWKEDAKDWDKVGDLKRLMDYNCIDVLRTWETAEAQRSYIRSIGQEAQMDFKMDTNHLCLRMMNRGVRIDKHKRAAMVYDLENARASYYQELEAIIPQAMVEPNPKKAAWYRSSKQTAELFYDILGFQVVKDRKTGNRTVGKEAFPILKRKYPEFTGLFDRLDMAGSVDNSLGVVQSPLDPDGRMRCSYNPGGTETHRLSSSANVFGRGTNLQNLTKGEEDE